jgi:hypothetical protein
VCWKMLKSGQREGKGVRLSIQGDWTDKSKAHPQRAYIETPLWTSTQILIMSTRTVK